TNRHPALGFWGKSGKSAVWWINDERRALCANDLGSEVEPELVIGSRIAGSWRTVHAAFDGLLLDGRRFICGQLLLSSKVAGALERRHRSEIPNPLKIRPAVRCSRSVRRRIVRLRGRTGRGSRGPLGERMRRVSQNSDRGEQKAQRAAEAKAHLRP